MSVQEERNAVRCEGENSRCVEEEEESKREGEVREGQEALVDDTATALASRC